MARKCRLYPGVLGVKVGNGCCCEGVYRSALGEHRAGVKEGGVRWRCAA